METLDGLGIVAFGDARLWDAWLADNHALPTGVWLKLARKASGIPSVAFADALEVALCFGWIDGQRRTHDGERYLQKFTPRRPKSTWSKVNIGRVEALIAAGRMRAPGFAQIEAAKSDGRWGAAYDSPRNATVPADLAAALEHSRTASETFGALARTERYAVIRRLMTATTAEIGSSRLQKVLAKLEKGEAPR